MVVSRQAFLVDFPEFQRVDPVFVERKLSAAEDVTPYNIWGTHRRMGIMLEAAHKIAISPIGKEARLGDDETETTYEADRKKLARTVAMGLGKVI